LGHQVQCECYFSTIHSAKGLEANSVLVIANTLNSLSRWLGISDSVTKESLADENNLGFVGFSRAREMLCVGCLQDTTSIIPRINELGMEIIAAN
jgi:DNA helicase-2/ATP-dependent DNA helicase PcrA